MNRNLMPPGRRILSTMRLPLAQRPGERIVAQLERSMMTRDALRRSKTTGNGVALGPLPAPQTFLLADVGYTNTPESMRSGLRARNAPRVANSARGQSAGM